MEKKNQTKTTLENLEEQINIKSRQIDALRYALRLAEKEHKNAADMVKDCPQNIYYDEWVRAEQVRGEYVATLKTIDAQLSNELDALCDQCEKAREEEAANHYELRPLNHLKTGDYFRKIRNGKPTSRVWVKHCWDASEKKYLCYAFDDTSDWCYIKGDTTIAAGFTF